MPRLPFSELSCNPSLKMSEQIGSLFLQEKLEALRLFFLDGPRKGFLSTLLSPPTTNLHILIFQEDCSGEGLSIGGLISVCLWGKASAIPLLVDLSTSRGVLPPPDILFSCLVLSVAVPSVLGLL